MAIAFRRARTALAAGLLVTSVALTAPPARAAEPLPGCEHLGSVQDGNGGWVSFCDDPEGYIRIVVGNLREHCEQGGCSARWIRCTFLGDCR